MSSVPAEASAAIARKPPRLPDESRVNFLELGWCLIRPDQQEILDHDFRALTLAIVSSAGLKTADQPSPFPSDLPSADPPVPAKYAHLFPGCSVLPEPVASTSALPARLHVDPLHLDEDDEGSDDELAIKPPPPARINTLKRPAPPAAIGSTKGGNKRAASSSPPPAADRAPPSSSQSHTVTNSSPSHFSASLDQRDSPAVKRARTSLGAAPQGSKVLVAASDSDVQSQESRIASQAQSGGSGSGSGTGAPQTSSGDSGQTTDSSAPAGRRAFPAFTGSTMDEPPFTLAQHTISLQVDSPSTSTPDDDPRRQQPFASLEAISAQPTVTTQVTSSIGRTQLSSSGNGDVEMRVLTAATEVSTEVVTSQEDESAELAFDDQPVTRLSMANDPSQNAEADESRTDDEGRIVPKEPGPPAPAAKETTAGPVLGAQALATEDVEMCEEEGKAPLDEAAAEASQGSLPDVLSRVQSGVQSLLQPIVAAADLLPAALQPTVRVAEEMQPTADASTSLDVTLADESMPTTNTTNGALPVQRGLTGSSASDADTVDALTQSAPPPVVPAASAHEDDIVADSQPPSRTRSQPGPSVGPDVNSEEEQAEAGGSLSVSQMPPPVQRREPSPPAQRRQPTPPPVPIEAPPPLPTAGPEIFDLRSASPEISVISPPPGSRSMGAATARVAPSNTGRPSASGGPSSTAPQAAAPVQAPPPPASSAPPRPPPPPPPPAAAPRPMPAYQPPKPTFTLSRTLDLPQHHGLPMFDDVMEILQRAQAYQSRRSR